VCATENKKIFLYTSRALYSTYKNIYTKKREEVEEEEREKLKAQPSAIEFSRSLFMRQFQKSSFFRELKTFFCSGSEVFAIDFSTASIFLQH